MSSPSSAKTTTAATAETHPARARQQDAEATPDGGERIKVRKRLPDNLAGMTGAAVLALALANVAFWCGGGIAPWVQGLLAAGIGLLVFLFPPQHGHSWPATAACLALVLWPLLGFLPMGWFGDPIWRMGLETDLGIAVGGRLSPQPWVTLEAWLLLSVAVLWFHYCGSRKWQDGDRVFIVFGLWLSLVVLFVCSYVFNQLEFVPDWWQHPHRQLNFGPFPNRNHIACLAAVGAVLGAVCGYDLFRRKSSLWLLPALMIILFFAAAMLVKSRAGVLLLFGGLGIWMFATAWQSRSIVRLTIAGSGLLVLIAGFLVFGRAAMERFTYEGETAIEAIQVDGRIPIYLDTLEQTVRSPIAGVGLGNFEPVFALTQTRSARMERNLHPESSWLKFSMEIGVLGLVLGLFLLWEISRRMYLTKKLRNKSRRRHRRLRFGAAVAGLVVVVHAFIDMPLHIPGTAFAGVLLLGMAVSQKQQQRRRGWGTPCYRGLGIGAMAVGLLLMANSTGAIALPGKTTARRAFDRAEAAWEQGRAEAAIAALDRAIAVEPMNWNAYFARAVYTIESDGSKADAIADFRRARYLEPHAPELPWQESQIWLRHDPFLALPAWREVLKRDVMRRHEYYDHMLGAARGDEELTRAVFDLAEIDGRLRLMVLRRLPTEEFLQRLDALLVSDPELNLLTSDQRRELFDLWADKGDREELLEELAANRLWLDDGWRIVAAEAARTGDFRRAFELAEQFVPAPPVPPVPTTQTMRELERDFRLSPTDVALGIRLFLSQRGNGLYREAVETLERVRRLGDAPIFLDYEEALLRAQMEQWEQAWLLLMEFDADLGS